MPQPRLQKKRYPKDVMKQIPSDEVIVANMVSILTRAVITTLGEKDIDSAGKRELLHRTCMNLGELMAACGIPEDAADTLIERAWVNVHAIFDSKPSRNGTS